MGSGYVRSQKFFNYLKKYNSLSKYLKSQSGDGRLRLGSTHCLRIWPLRGQGHVIFKGYG